METTFTFDMPSEQVYDRLDEVFTLLRTHLQGGGQLKSLSENTISDLKEIALSCDEAGYLASVLLWRNGILFEPDCEPAVEESKPILMGTDVKSEPLILSPNPCDESLTIECSCISSLNCKFFLFDILGQIVLETDLSNLPGKKVVDTKHIMSGIYFARFSGINKAGQSLKVIVAH